MRDDDLPTKESLLKEIDAEFAEEETRTIADRIQLARQAEFQMTILTRIMMIFHTNPEYITHSVNNIITLMDLMFIAYRDNDFNKEYAKLEHSKKSHKMWQIRLDYAFEKYELIQKLLFRIGMTPKLRYK